MKVLAYNTLDSAHKIGGALTQFAETERELKELGVKVEAPAKLPDSLGGYDLVHIYGLQTIWSGMELLHKAKAHGLPVVLSTIYWDLDSTNYAEDCLRYSTSGLARVASKFSFTLARNLLSMRYIRGRLRTRSLQETALREADVLLPNSVAELEILVSKFNMPGLRAKSAIVPNGVTEQGVPEMPPKALKGLPEKYVMQAASFHPVKGQARLINALMNDKHIPVVCIGPCGGAQKVYYEYCQKLAQERGNTFLLGGAEYNEMPCYYSRAKVHVLPSMRESPGLASLEAAIYGANCVISIHAPVWEYFGHDAYVCDPENLDSVRKAVLQAWTAPTSKALKARILRDFTWRKAAEATLNAYEWVVQSKKEKNEN